MIKQKRALRGALALAAASGVAVSALTGAGTAWADRAGNDRADQASLSRLLDRLTTVDGGPGALLHVRDRRGDTVLTSGVADVQSQAPMPRDSRFRIGSMTKPFVATVVLQLVGEHRVSLDAPVERYLPGVVRGAGNDGRKITVRQLLQHTSGVPDYLAHLDPRDILADPLAHHDTRDLMNVALANQPTFAPGTGWQYSNTNYLLAGMLIENVTGRTWNDEVRRRIIVPLGLRHTSAPEDETAIPGPHPRGYVRPGQDAPLTDLTGFNPSVAGAAGAMISSGADVDRFLGALVDGRLLRPAQLREMMRTRPTGDSGGRAYGLGLESRPLPCGGLYWGHGGDIFGYETVGGATVGGGQATAVVNLDPGGTDAQSDDMRAAVETALCGGRSTASR
ncbi:serine hydrolase domain-containing protein [Actinomadura atramentaria]|uniref:serine hydrolase domain-containing protein n=1 Tax=Actinomadura atramentaria TaxID=1990 RepID=UPI000374A1E5|nr:serine hydrolase domain-containing protein [Actinomadura atramentaria]